RESAGEESTRGRRRVLLGERGCVRRRTGKDAVARRDRLEAKLDASLVEASALAVEEREQRAADRAAPGDVQVEHAGVLEEAAVHGPYRALPLRVGHPRRDGAFARALRDRRHVDARLAERAEEAARDAGALAHA